jgi:ElaB/YqjD/DUF883 family membrane-anchored ribosome-binding protein
MVKARLKKRPRVTSRRTARAVHNGLDLQHRLENIKDSLGEISGTLSDKASIVVAKSIKKARKQSKRVNRYVHDKPFRSVAIAAVTFVCLGFLFRR